jgi:hypothetical protein
VFTARYALSPYIKQIRYVFKGLKLVISGFSRDTDETCPLLEHYAASCGNNLPTFRDKVSAIDFFTLEDGTDTLSRNVGKVLPFDAP